MPWKETSVMEELLRFVVRLLDGEGMSEVCRSFGISRKAGYKERRMAPRGSPEALPRPTLQPLRATPQGPARGGLPLPRQGGSGNFLRAHCMHRKKINISTVMAGRRLGIKEVDDAIWLVNFVHDGLGHIDLEQRTLQQ